jgi:membrane protein required for colicin V production
MNIGVWHYNSFDIVVLLILLISSLLAFKRGLKRELASILSLLLAAFTTFIIYGSFGYAAQELISPIWLANTIVGIGTFSLTYAILFFTIRKTLNSLTGKDTGIIDNVLGAFFGLMRGFIIASLGVMLLTSQYRASQDAKSFRNFMKNNPETITEEIMKKMPKFMKEQLNATEFKLPNIYKNSTIYPLLNLISNKIQTLPFAKMRSYAEQVKKSKLDDLFKENK